MQGRGIHLSSFSFASDSGTDDSLLRFSSYQSEVVQLSCDHLEKGVHNEAGGGHHLLHCTHENRLTLFPEPSSATCHIYSQEPGEGTLSSSLGSAHFSGSLSRLPWGPQALGPPRGKQRRLLLGGQYGNIWQLTVTNKSLDAWNLKYSQQPQSLWLREERAFSGPCILPESREQWRGGWGTGFSLHPLGEHE